MRLDPSTIVLMTLLAGALPTLVAAIIGALLRRAISGVDASIGDVRSGVSQLGEKMDGHADRLARLEERVSAQENHHRWWRR